MENIFGISSKMGGPEKDDGLGATLSSACMKRVQPNRAACVSAPCTLSSRVAHGKRALHEYAIVHTNEGGQVLVSFCKYL
jgi:hypothetical protein